MKAYGYEVDSDVCRALSEVTLQFDQNELADFIAFLSATAQDMSQKQASFGHAHLADFLQRKNGPDIIVMGIL